MSLSIVIALFCSSIMLFSLFFIAKVHCSESRVNVGDDFITVFLKDRERVIKKSGSRMAISTYLLILGISPLAVGAFVYFFSQNGLFSILMAFMGFLIPDIILMIIRNSTQKKYEERYARALNQMGSSLRAGLSIARAVEDVAQCKFVHPSMQKCFAKLSADLQMGLPVSEAFQRMQNPVRSTAHKYKEDFHLRNCKSTSSLSCLPAGLPAVSAYILPGFPGADNTYASE